MRKLTADHRTAHFYVAEFGPITSAELAERLGRAKGATAGLVTTLVSLGHVRQCEEWTQVGAVWTRQWEVTGVPLPDVAHATSRSVAAAKPKPVRRPYADPVRAAKRAREARAAFELEQAQQQARAEELRAKLFDAAEEAGLGPLVVGGRVSIPHPLGEPGRVWLDGPGDLRLALLDRDLAGREAEHAAA